MTRDAVLTRIDQTLPKAPERLPALQRIPLISTDPAQAGDCAHAVGWLEADLRNMGFVASARPKGTSDGGSSGGPHLLFYGHHGVRPIDAGARVFRDLDWQERTAAGFRA